jgi:hypothetical protein
MALKIYIYLCGHINSKRYASELKVYPTINTLVNKLRISKPQCIKYLNLLSELGWIQKVQTKGYRNNSYILGTVVNDKEVYYSLNDENPIPQPEVNKHTGRKKGKEGEPIIGKEGEPIIGKEGEPKKLKRKTDIGKEGEPKKLKRNNPNYYSNTTTDITTTSVSTTETGKEGEPMQEQASPLPFISAPSSSLTHSPCDDAVCHNKEGITVSDSGQYRQYMREQEFKRLERERLLASRPPAPIILSPEPEPVLVEEKQDQDDLWAGFD